MSQLASWEAEGSGNELRQRYEFVWKRAKECDKSAEAIHQVLLGENYQYTDQHVWVEWLDTRLDSIDGDVSLEIVPARTKWLKRNL
jgi:hypothetical protein